MEARSWLAVLQVASCSFREPDLGWKEVEATGGVHVAVNVHVLSIVLWTSRR
jgi:hypothetical protein